MAISFTPLQLSSSTYFGIRLQGSFGRADKKRLKDLASKCLTNHKTKLVLDLSRLDSLGGGGAAELAALQQQLVELDGELVVTGASPTVLQFLTRSFEGIHLRCYQDIAGAERDLGGNSAAEASRASGRQGARDVDEAAEEDLQLSPDSSLDEILGASIPVARGAPRSGEKVVNTVEDPVLPSETPPPDPAGRSKPKKKSGQSARPGTDGESSASDRVINSRRYVSLNDAVNALQETVGPEDLGEQILNLLHSHDLAKEVIYCRREGNWFLGEDGKRSFTASGKLALTLAGAQRPLSLLDISTDELDKGENRFLTKTSPDLILPVLWHGQLQAVAFLQRGKKDHEYSVSENFALELLMRVMAAYGDRRAVDEPVAGEDQDSEPADTDIELAVPEFTSDEVYLPDDQLDEQLDDPTLEDLFADSPEDVASNKTTIWTRSLLRLVEAMAGVLDEENFWEKVHQRLAGDHGIRNLVVLIPSGGRMVPHVSFGVLASKSSRLEIGGVTGRRYLEGIVRPVTLDNLPSSFKKFQTAMRKAELKWLVPLQANLDWIGIALIGEVESGKMPIGEDQAAEMFTKVAAHLQRLRERNIVEERNLELIKRLMSLMEERHYGPGGISGELIKLVQRVAREMGFSPEQERDLVYGTIIRDIGMFPTGDLIIDSFGNVSEEQWQEYRSHPNLGAERLEGLSISAIVREVVLYHHERFNGEGYPQGCSGHDIPLAARIVAVVENYVAMVTTMPNRPALSRTQALEIIQENFGSRYDPEVVAAFLRVLENEKSGTPSDTVLVHS